MSRRIVPTVAACIAAIVIGIVVGLNTHAVYANMPPVPEPTPIPTPREVEHPRPCWLFVPWVTGD